jgi:DNA adenine methylase
MNGYPAHEECGGLMMLPSAVGMPMPEGADGVVFCTTCFPKHGLIAPKVESFEKARAASRAAGVVELTGDLCGGHIGNAGRLALHHAVCGDHGAARKKRSTFALLKALRLLDDNGNTTEAGRALAARIGLSVDAPPRAIEREQHALPIDLSLRKPAGPNGIALLSPAYLEPQEEPASVALDVDAAQARSPLKWVGSKGKLLASIVPALPPTFGRLFVPFVGGGALPFAIGCAGAYLSDANPHLVNVYLVIRDSVEDLILALADHRNDRVYYDALKESFNDGYGDPVWHAAAFVYMNKVGFNGLCRYNRAGKYNVPFGDNPKATICDADNLRACSVALRDTTIEAADFRAVEAMAQPGDMAFFDPPYVPDSKTASFTGYWGKWGDDDHADVAAMFRRLVARGVHVLASNSDTPKVRELYDGFEMRTLARANSINSKASARGGKTELLILGGTWTPRGVS